MRIAARAASAIGALLLPATSVPAAEPAELRALFPREADVFVARDGLSRLVLPPAVLSLCRPDLSDLRLFDREEREVPFLLDRIPAPAASLELVQRFDAPIVEAARAEERRDSGPPLRRETFELELPDEPPRSGSWVLVADSRLDEFVARVTVESLGEDGAAGALIDEGSLFRLRGPRHADKLRLALPPFSGARLRVTLESEERSWVEPSFRLENAGLLEVAGQIAVPLFPAETIREAGRTVVSLDRPRGIIPELLRIATDTGTLDRGVVVRDEGPGSTDAPLASERVFRVAALAPVADLDLELRPARGDRLRVEIDDADSPPLLNLAFFAVIRQPSLIFSSKEPGAERSAGTLRFGGGRAQVPRYDLAGLLPSQATGQRAEAAALLHDPAVVAPARLGTARDNAAYDRAPALAFAMRPGAGIDRRVFTHIRPLSVPRSPEGLSRLTLTAEDLAILREDLSDLRIADPTSRQWPYLLERGAVAETVPLAVDAPDRREGTSRYAIELPVHPARIERISLHCDEPYFDRAYRLTGVGDDDGQERILAEGRIVRAVGDPRPVRIDLPPARVRTLVLTVEDADDASLAFHSVQARVPVAELYLTAPEGEYTLLLGAPDQRAARYDLERVRAVVLAVQAAPVRAQGLDENPDFSLQARLKGSGFGQRALLWSVLIAAVLILGATTLRLARQSS